MASGYRTGESRMGESRTGESKADENRMSEKGKTFVGFGFGPIQSGLFLYEASRSGNFNRFVVVDVDTELVDALRKNGGTYYINIARENGIDTEEISGVEIFNPNVPEDREHIIEAISQSDEMCTALPSVGFYDRGESANVARLIAEGLIRRWRRQPAVMKPTIVYSAENNNHAAEILLEGIKRKIGETAEIRGTGQIGEIGGTGQIGEIGGSYDYAYEDEAGLFDSLQCLNTVIGKMSGVIRDAETIEELSLAPFVPGVERAFLVEEFNKIYISRIRLKGYSRGIEVFIEKDDLLPFEEAKLYGHNSIHALIAYLGDVKGYTTIAEAGRDAWIMERARKAFLEESGGALVRKYEKLGDALFTDWGYMGYAEDLLKRMVNPFLHDSIERVGRDRPRKLGMEDRIFGTMRLALEYGIEPINLSLGAAAAIVSMIRRRDTGSKRELVFPEDTESWRYLSRREIANILYTIWGKSSGVGKSGEKKTERLAERLIDLTFEGYKVLKEELGW